MPDDWELDDWDDDAFDEDVWDVTQLDLEGDEDLEALDAEAPPATSTRVNGGEETVGWSAWEVGTVFALGGWLADHHAEQVGQHVADALRDGPSGRGHDRAPAGPRRAAPHPPPSTGYAYEAMATPCLIGYPLNQQALFADLIAACALGHDLLVQAEGEGPSGGRLVLVMSAVGSSTGPRLWVVAEEHPRGFSATRLVPVFQRDQVAGVGVFATDYAIQAADAAVWACQREGVTLESLTVTHRRR